MRRDRRRRGRRRSRRIFDLVRPVAVELREATPGAQHEREGEERYVGGVRGCGIQARLRMVAEVEDKRGTSTAGPARHQRSRHAGAIIAPAQGPPLSPMPDAPVVRDPVTERVDPLRPARVMRMRRAVGDERILGHALEAAPDTRRDRRRASSRPGRGTAPPASRSSAIRSVVVQHQLDPSADAGVVQGHVPMPVPALDDAAVDRREVDLAERDEMGIGPSEACGRSSRARRGCVAAARSPRRRCRQPAPSSVPILLCSGVGCRTSLAGAARSGNVRA